MTGYALTEFGFCPRRLTVRAGPVSLAARQDLADVVARVREADEVERGWIYAPRSELAVMGAGTRPRPYSVRVFGLPRTHWLHHETCEGEDHLVFLLWALSFFTGLRLTATAAGFVDATPLDPGTLVDFHVDDVGLGRAIALAEAFRARQADDKRCTIFAGAVHALFLAQYPLALGYERFGNLCAALDACFALFEIDHDCPPRLGHARRVAHLCTVFGIAIPPWAEAVPGRTSSISAIRNAAVHEALFLGQPYGFSLLAQGEHGDVTLQMEALICRLLVALIGAPETDYVRSPIDTRQAHDLILP